MTLQAKESVLKAVRDRLNDESAQAESRRVAGQSGQGREGIGRSPPRVAVTHHEIVIGDEETVEAKILGCLGQCHESAIASALLRFGENSVVQGSAPQSISAITSVPNAESVSAGAKSVNQV